MQMILRKMLRTSPITGYNGARIKKKPEIVWEGIVKAQRPITSITSSASDFKNSCLFYDEGKENIHYIITLSDDEMDIVFGGELKVYLKATLYAGGEFALHGRVNEQDW